MKVRLFFALLFIFVIPSGSLAAEFIRARVSSFYPLQGDVVMITFSDSAPTALSAEFDGEPVSVFSYQGLQRVLFGISPTKNPGYYPVRVIFKNGEVFEEKIQVRARKFSKVVLGIPEKLELTPTGLVAKLQTEKVKIEDIVSIKTPEIFFSSPFGLPLVDNRKVTSLFGEIRKTGNTEIRHLGVDLAGKLGAGVGAINGGVVKKAYYDTVYGNSVIIDHGQGIFSLYLHLNKIKVKEGDVLKKGALVGTLGQTGYATSPHLHLSLKIGNVPVDPFRFVSIFK